MRISRPKAAPTVVSPRRAVRALALAVALACAGGAAEAAGLGRLQVLSGLGQPLRAEIELTSVSREEAGTLAARLASPDAYNRAKIDYSPALSGLRFAIEQRPNGSEVLRITSAAPINEPFLDLLIELNGGSGRLVREYTFLLDPPELRATRPEPIAPIGAPVATAPGRPAAAVAPQAPQAPAPAVTAGAAAARLAAAQAARPSAPASYQVRGGDTLLKIARGLQPAGVTLEQMLVSLFRNNTSAFDGQNMNRLRAGSILRVPTSEQITAITPAEAGRVFTAQSADFANYRKTLAGSVAETPLEKSAGASREASGKITAKVDDKTGPADASRDRVQLSKATPTPPGGATAAAPAKAVEDAALRDRALQEAGARVALLEKTVADLQKLIELKNQNLLELQKQAALQGKSLPPGVAPVVNPAATSAAPPAPAGTAASPAGTTPTPAASTPAAPAKAPAKAATPSVQPSMIDELLANPLALGGGAAILLLLAGFAVYNLRRKKKLAGFEDSNLTGLSSLHANSVFGVAGGGSVDTRNSGFNSNFIPLSGQSVDANEVDPVAEADVYIAYGRDAQAEEILKEALRTQPDRIAVRLKLLELYAKRKDAEEFEVVANDLYNITKGVGPDWKIAETLGAELDPENSLYQTAGTVGIARAAAGSGTANDKTVVMSAAAMATAGVGASLAAAATPVAVESFHDTMPGTPALDLDLGQAETKRGGGAAQEAPAALDLDFDLAFDAPKVPGTATAEVASVQTGASVSAAAAAPSASPDFMSSLDFDLDLSPVAPANPVPAIAEPSSGKAGDLEPLAFAPVMPSDGPVAGASNESTGSSGAAANESALDFAFDFELPESGGAAEPAVPGMPEAADARLNETSTSFDKTTVADKSFFAGISLDLDSGTADSLDAPAEDLDEPGRAMATKLELAAAYRDIGDTDGARELLEEVVKGGTATQVEKAAELLKALAS